MWKANFRLPKGGRIMGKKHRSRTGSPKKNNHIPPEAIEAEHNAHAKENSATGGRKNKQQF
jgi:hypothetical protein